MRKYLSSLLFILACLIFSYYNALSIRHMTTTWAWHLAQWVSVALFLCAGVEFGRWIARGKFTEIQVSDIGEKFLGKNPLRLYDPQFNFHDFGRIVSLALCGVPAYVFFLHFLLSGMQ